MSLGGKLEEMRRVLRQIREDLGATLNIYARHAYIRATRDKCTVCGDAGVVASLRGTRVVATHVCKNCLRSALGHIERQETREALEAKLK